MGEKRRAREKWDAMWGGDLAEFGTMVEGKR